MNLQSEIDYFSELPPLDQARLLAVFLHELTAEAREAERGNDPAPLPKPALAADGTPPDSG